MKNQGTNQVGDEGTYIPPLTVVVGPLKTFCEVNFSGDSIYRSLELQYLEFGDGRCGHLVTLWRLDDKLDVYFDPSLKLDAIWWSSEPALADIPMGELIPTELRSVRLIAGSSGLDAQVEFDDIHGRLVTLTATATSAGRVRRLFVPSVLRPRAKLLRALYLFELGPMSQKDQADVSIAGIRMSPTLWPWPIGLRRSMQARHGDNMVLVGLNVSGPVDRVGWEGLDQGSSPRWTSEVEGHQVELAFSPPIACLHADGTAPDSAGSFVLSIDREPVTTGEFRTSNAAGSQAMALSLTGVRQSWRPAQRDLSVVMLEAARRLKARRRAWAWSGTVEAEDDGGALLTGEWSRR